MIAPDVLISSLCEHGTEHLWERLIWICDIAEPISTGRGSSRTRHASERMLLLGLRLASDVLGAPIPEPMRRRAVAT
jgi:hypothetical protein